MPKRKSVETKHKERRQFFHGRRNLDRRSFLKVSAAAFGATAGIAAMYSSLPEPAAFADAATASKEESEKDAISKSLLAARCPVTGKRVSKEISVAYKGGKLYFSDADCIDKFKANKTKYETKANLQLAITGQVRQIQCPLGGGELDAGTKMNVCGVDVCFCCTDCQEEVKRASAAKQVELVFGKGFEKAFALQRPRKADGQPSSGEPAADEWRCNACGYVHVGPEPPATCPACGATSYSFDRVSKTP